MLESVCEETQEQQACFKSLLFPRPVFIWFPIE